MNEFPFLDSNIFIYAADKDSVYYEESVSVLTRLLPTGFLRQIYV